MKRMIKAQYIPDMTERFPEGMDGVDLTDSYFPPEESYLDYLPEDEPEDDENPYADGVSRMSDEKLRDAYLNLTDVSILPREGFEDEIDWNNAVMDAMVARFPEEFEWSDELIPEDTAEGEVRIPYTDDDEPIYEGLYLVSSITPSFEPAGNNKAFNDPGDAILYWFKESRQYPTCTCIDSLPQEGEELRQWVLENEDQVRQWAAEYKCPYKIDWLIETCAKPYRASSSKYPDQIHPFSLG